MRLCTPLCPAWLLCPQKFTSPAFAQHDISITGTGAISIYRIFPIDLDRDGDMDVVGSLDSGGDATMWYENTGGGAFTAHVIDLQSRTISVHAIDVDGDGTPILPHNSTMRYLLSVFGVVGKSVFMYTFVSLQ